MLAAPSVKAKMVVVDGKDLRRAAVASLFEEWAAVEQMEIVPTLSDAISDIEEIHLVMLSIGGEGLSDDEHKHALSWLRHCTQGIPLVVLADDSNPEQIATAIPLGAQGYIETEITPEVASHVLSSLLRGGSYFPLSALQALVHERDQVKGGDGSSNGNGHSKRGDVANLDDDLNPADDPDHDCLQPRFTDRQRDVVCYLRRGSSNKAIARKLGMAETTVKVHVRQILRKLGASDRTEAAVLLREDEVPETSPREEQPHV
jgi:DNA-binding NarL/FixJ family response regulator